MGESGRRKKTPNVVETVLGGRENNQANSQCLEMRKRDGGAVVEGVVE